MKGIGSVNVNLVRSGGDLSKRVAVSYRTMDGTAINGSHYLASEGMQIDLIERILILKIRNAKLK